MLSLTKNWSRSFVKILSIRVAHVLCTRVGLSIVGIRLKLCADIKNLWLMEDDCDFSRSMLISPIM